MSSANSPTSRDAWVAMQKKTFTRWANQYLAKRSLAIEDLSTDLKSGLILANLLEVISDGESVGRINRNPKMEIQMYENLNLCLKFLKDHDINLVNIGSQDIYKSNEKLILGLLWTIILRYEVSDADGKQGLLLWVQRSVKSYDNVAVTNFTASWNNGLSFCALIHRYRPDLIDYDSLTADNAMENCELAFSIAEEKLGIARLLDPEDIADVASPDEKSVVAYVSQFFKLFAGAARNETLIKAIKNAIQVSKRHDEWVQSYNDLADNVMGWAGSNTADLLAADSSSSTDEVKAKLDEFAAYLRDTKPLKQSARDEVSTLFVTLTVSKRNNKRPEFKPEVTPDMVDEVWDGLELAEREHERMLLEKYLRFRRVDHLVSSFGSKQKSLESNLTEKENVFDAGVEGSLLQEIESQLEVHDAYGARLDQFKRLMVELEAIAEQIEGLGEGHAGAEDVATQVESAREHLETVEAKGEAHYAALQDALEAEKVLLKSYKLFMHQTDHLDFELDQLTEKSTELEFALSIAQIDEKLEMAHAMNEPIDVVTEEIAQVAELATLVVAKLPDAESDAADLERRVTELKADVAATTEKLLARKETETLNEVLRHKFADAANAFADFCELKQSELGEVQGSLEEQQEAIARVKEETKEGDALIEELTAIAEECEAAEIVANPYTPNTLNSLKASYEQVGKAIKLADDAVADQIQSLKAFEVPAEVLREIKQVYEFFDVGRLNAMSLQQLREACKGAGLDLDDDEVEARMRARKPSMLFTLDDFIALNLEELQTGDSKDDVVAAFRAIGGGGSSTLSEDQINTLFMSDPEVAEYLRNNLNDEDFASFTDKLFTR